MPGRAIPQHYGDGGDVLALVVLQGCVVARPAWCACPEPPVEVAGDAGDRSASDIGSQRRARKLRLPMRRLRLPRLPRRRRQQKPHARDSDPTQHTDDAEADALGNEDPGDGDTVCHVSWCAACGLLAARDVPAPATKFAVAASSYGRGRFMWLVDGLRAVAGSSGAVVQFVTQHSLVDRLRWASSVEHQARRKSANGMQEYIVGQMYHVTKKRQFQSLIGRIRNSFPRIPLPPVRREGSTQADVAQAMKDLRRERGVLVNGVEFPLGTDRRLHHFMGVLSDVIRTAYRTTNQRIQDAAKEGGAGDTNHASLPVLSMV